VLKNFSRRLFTYIALAVFVLLTVVVTAQVGTAQIVPTNTGPDVIATQIYDNFENYGNTLPVTNWPNPGGYMINPWGDPDSGLFPSLNTDYKADGNYSMKLDYNLEQQGWAGMGHLLDHPDWSAWDGVSYWVKPDGSGRTLTFTFLEQVGSDGVHHFHSADYQMTGTAPVIVTIPWSAFGVDNTAASAVEEQVWYIEGAPGPGTIYVDEIQLIKTASPLSGIVVTPATAQIYDNFESYGNTLPVTNWPNSGGYMINPWSDPDSGLFPSLSTDYKADGNYSMKLGYNLEQKGWAGTGHLLDHADWSAWDGVSYWVKPDGSGRTLTFSFQERTGPDGVAHIHSADYQMTGTVPVIVTIPWSAFGVNNTAASAVEQQVWYIKGAPGPGAIYVDEIQLIKIASPSGIIVTLAS